MGEYAKLHGKEIKIGTCEEMYYLRYDQRFMIEPLPNSLNPRDKAILEVIRFRFPFPDEDKSLPGGNGPNFDPFRKLRIDDVSIEDQEHYTVQFNANNGYLVNLPCPEGKQTNGLKIHKNGYGGAVHLCQQRVKDGLLMPVFECGGCGAKWRIENNEELKPYISSLENQIERATGESKEWYRKILDRMMVKPA